MRATIGECLRQAGVISEEELRVALVEQKRSGERLGAVLVRLNLASERQIARAISTQLGFEYVDLVTHPPDPAAVTLIPKDVALKRNCIAVAAARNVLTVAMSDPMQFTLVQDLEFQTGCRVKQVVAAQMDICNAIEAGYGAQSVIHAPSTRAQVRGRHSDSAGQVSQPGADESARLHEETGVDSGRSARQVSTGDSAPIIDMVNLIIRGALRSRASDIHIEPTEDSVIVRHRLDGLLKEMMDVPKWVHDGLVARVKIMAGLDIAEKRLPQDGRIRAAADDGHEIDVRVSTLRTIFGEKIVLRLLDHRKGLPPLDELGLSVPALDRIRFFLRHQHGMILVVGPTGSGKTTTLSSALATIRSGRTNIVTIEDPVEYQIPGVNQTQINAKINLTFASALRSILRQDPDVVLVGEIRDQETARIAMQAAQTGHLVLSTLHTDDAPSCVTRLTDIGIEPYVAASALIGVVAQRLVRRLCMNCRCPYSPEPEALRAMGFSGDEPAQPTFYRAVGCEKCKGIGYRGRVGIYEIMTVTDELRRLIAQRGTEVLLRETAIASGMISLGEDGLSKVTAGITTPQELLRVVTEVRQTGGQCRRCRTRLFSDFIACPNCGERAGRGCPHCFRPVQSGWKFCAFCAQPIGMPEVERATNNGTNQHLVPALPAGSAARPGSRGRALGE